MYKSALYAGEWAEDMVRRINNYGVLAGKGSFALVVDRQGKLAIMPYATPMTGNRMVFRFKGVAIGAVLEAIPTPSFYTMLVEGDPDGTLRKSFMKQCVANHNELHGSN